MSTEKENTFPFSYKHLKQFKEELEEAGSFENLMVRKEAITDNESMDDVITHNDISGYKKRFLVGAYITLRPMYDTEIPYIFWNELYQTLLLVEKDAQ